MKTISKITLIALATLSFAASSHAEQYSIYVTHAESVNPAQNQFSNLVQKEITIDTGNKNLTFSVAPVCRTGFCPEMLNNVSFKIKSFERKADLITRLKAEGTIVIRGVPTPTQILISLNMNNATTIQITSDLITDELDSRLTSVFYGSPSVVNTTPVFSGF
jgi:hypothetical protein